MPDHTNRSSAESAFHEWLEESHRNPELEAKDFLDKLDSNLRQEVGQMIGDYETLSGAIDMPSSFLKAGQSIDDFQLIREIGRGGVGVVWEAEQVSLKRRVALKVLRPQFSLSPVALQRFQREAEAGARLQHAGIVQTYGVGEFNGTHWIAQELVPGGFTLADALGKQHQRTDFSTDWYDQTASCFLTIAEALEIAHQAGILHRDIKPLNILFGEDSQPKIADFGLARFQDDLGLSRSGEFLGTPFYMSPEQAQAGKISVDHRTDIFSFGATLYEALTLTRAFDGDTSQQVFHKIISDDPPNPRKLRSRVPIDLSVICEKCLEKNPGKRYQTMGEVAADIRRYLMHKPILAKPQSVASRVGKWCRRHPVLSATGFISSVALLIISVLAIKISGEQKQTEIALSRAIEAEASTAKGALEIEENAYVANIEMAAAWLELNQPAEMRRRLDDCPDRLKDTWEWGWLDAQQDTSLAIIPNCSDTALFAESSQYGPGIFTFSKTGEAKVWSLEGSLRTNLAGHKDSFTIADFDPVGLRAALWRGIWQNRLRIWDVQKGKLLFEIAGLDGEDICALDASFIHDGKQLILAWDSGRIEVVNSVSGQRENTILPAFAFGSPEEIYGDILLTVSPDDSKIFVARCTEHAQILDLTSGSLITELPIPNGAYSDSIELEDGITHGSSFDGFYEAEFDQNGTRIALAYFSDPSDKNSSCLVYDLIEAKFIAMFEGHTNSITSINFSPLGDKIVTSSEDGTARVWDIASEKMLAELNGHSNAVVDAEFSHDGEYIVTASADATAIVWDWKNRNSIAILMGHTKGLISAEFSADDAKVVTRSHDETTRLWDSTPPYGKFKPRPWEGRAEKILFSLDGRRFLQLMRTNLLIRDSLSGDCLFKVPSFRFDVKAQHLYEEHVFDAEFSPDGSRVLISQQSLGVRILDSTTGEELVHFDIPKSKVHSVQYSNNGELVATSLGNGNLGIWDAKNGNLLATLETNEEWVEAIDFSPNDEKVVIGYQDCISRVWDIGTGECLNVLNVLNVENIAFLDIVSTALFHPGGELIATSTGNPREVTDFTCDHPIWIWDSETGQLLHSLVGHKDDVTHAAFSPNGKTLATTSMDGSTKIWDPFKGILISTLKSQGSRPRKIAFSPDGTRLAIGTSDGIQIWDPLNGNFLLELNDNDRWCSALQFSPDGKTILSSLGSYGDDSLLTWDSVPYRKRHPALQEFRQAKETMRPILKSQLSNGNTPFEIRTWLKENSALSTDEKIAGQAIVQSMTEK